jgi:hypothetical protein
MEKTAQKIENATCVKCETKFYQYGAGLSICDSCFNKLKKTEKGRQEYNELVKKNYKPCILYDDCY